VRAICNLTGTAFLGAMRIARKAGSYSASLRARRFMCRRFRRSRHSRHGRPSRPKAATRNRPDRHVPPSLCRSPTPVRSVASRRLPCPAATAWCNNRAIRLRAVSFRTSPGFRELTFVSPAGHAKPTRERRPCKHCRCCNYFIRCSTLCRRRLVPGCARRRFAAPPDSEGISIPETRWAWSGDDRNPLPLRGADPPRSHNP